MSERRPPFNCGDQHLASWRQRAATAAQLLAGVPELRAPGASVADIGCGDGKLREALRAAAIPAAWRGYDLHPQAADVQAFDVQRDTLPTGHTVAVLLGVVEYLPDLPRVLTGLAAAVPFVLLSHVQRDPERYPPARLRELGWCNHLATADVDALLRRAGFGLRAQSTTPDGRTQVLLAARQQVPTA